MEQNFLYNLMHEFVAESKALWHIRKFYVDDAVCHKDCEIFWKDVIQNKEAYLEKLKKMIQGHLSSAGF